MSISTEETSSQKGSSFSWLIEESPTRHGSTGPQALDIHRRSDGTATLRVGAFFVFLALIIFCVHYLIQFGMRSIKTGEFGVTNQIVTGSINAEIVISGSSRALNHYDPRIIQEITGFSSFNIGRNGSQTDMQVAILKTYLQHNKVPKLVIHNLDSFSFVITREIYDPAQYLPYLNEKPIYAAVAKITPHAWKWRRLPLYGYAVEDMRFTWLLGLRQLMGLHPKDDQFLGYQPRYTAWSGDFEEFRRSNPSGVRFEIEADGVRDLEEIAIVCRRHHIPLLLVYSPVYFEMREIEANRNEITAKFQEVANSYSVPIWDYSESPICRDRAHFYNSQHLNAGGAALFSRDLAERLSQGGIPATSMKHR